MIDNDYNHVEEDNIEETANGYKFYMRVPNRCFGMIIGRKGSTLKQLQQQTETKIKLPTSNSHSDHKNGKIELNNIQIYIKATSVLVFGRTIFTTHVHSGEIEIFARPLPLLHVINMTLYVNKIN